MEMPMAERYSLSEISDALVALEKLDDTHLRLVQQELDRMQKHRQLEKTDAMAQQGTKANSLDSVLLGSRFIYRTAVVLGTECSNSRMPPFEGEVLTVVGFEPRYKNNVVVQESNGRRCLLPISMVKTCLTACGRTADISRAVTRPAATER